MRRTISACVVAGFCMMFVRATARAEEKLTITTYYPSPTGVYQTLRLNPANETAIADPQPGQLYYNMTIDKFRYVNKTKQWVTLSASGSGGLYWENDTLKTGIQNLANISGANRKGCVGISGELPMDSPFPLVPLHVGDHAQIGDIETYGTISGGQAGVFDRYNILFGDASVPNSTFGMGHDSNMMFFNAKGGYLFYLNSTWIQMFINNRSQMSVGINNTTVLQRLDVNGSIRLQNMTALPAGVEGSIYYNKTTATPAYRDASQWNNFISEYGVIAFSGNNATTNATVSFNKTYAVPPIVMVTANQKGWTWDNWDGSHAPATSLICFVRNTTKTNFIADVNSHGDSPSNGTGYYAGEVFYIVIPNP